MTDLMPPSVHPGLRSYLADVVAWHGYVRFLGLPSYQNNPDVPIDELYVPQALSDSYLSPDSPSTSWTTRDPVQQLLEHRHLVVLGDPGSGKSTLINWFAWYLASGFARKLPGELADLLPVPLVLRDLAFGDTVGFEGLIDAFLKRPVAQNLAAQPDLLLQYLEGGRVLLLVDGLDEVGAELRRLVRDALLEGIAQYPGNHLLCTSRIVGYSEAPLIHDNSPNGDDVSAAAIADRIRSTERLVRVSYVAPFNDEQIERFALNWYRDQGGPDREARLLRDDFVAAIRSNDSTLRLARTPNLLTMMALVFRVRARLPNGRALLYEDIAQAYLESIDVARKLKDEFPWQSKKRWLARVGFEMQLRRSETAEEGMAAAAQELLVPRQEVLQWIDAAITQSGDTAAAGYAEKYLDWIMRRSGLLLPRGEGQFAFLHLSFQEFFAALYVKQQMENPDWVTQEEDPALDDRVTRGAIGKWSRSDVWQQVFVFLFELFAGQPGWTKRLMAICFPSGWQAETLKSLEEESTSSFLGDIRLLQNSSVGLSLKLLSNPHAGLSSEQLQALLGTLGSLAMAEQQDSTMFRLSFGFYGSGNLLSTTLSMPAVRSSALQWLKDRAPRQESLALDLVASTGMEDLLPIVSTMHQLVDLEIRLKAAFDVTPLASLTNLLRLTIRNALVPSLEPLRALGQLQRLSLWQCTVRDLAPLSDCRQLRALILSFTTLSDLSTLMNMQQLEYLSIAYTEIVDIGALSRLKALRVLTLDHTSISDISALSGLKHLESLFLEWSQVTDFSPLLSLKSLKRLKIHGAVEEVARAQLASLEELKIEVDHSR